MKNLIHPSLFARYVYLAAVIAATVFSNQALAAPELSAKQAPGATILNTQNPSKSVGIQIGDLLSREVEIEVSQPHQISKNAFPVKGANHDGVELANIQVETKTSDEKTHYKIKLTYQVFSYADKPAVRQLPAERIAISGNNQAALSVDIPAWRFWQASLVPIGIKNAKDHVQPQYKPTLIDLPRHQIALITLLSLLIIGAIGLVYINADKHWLPWMNGAFAQAHRKIKN